VNRLIATVVLGILAAAPLRITAQGPADPAWQDVGRLLHGTPVDGGGYVRFNFPRSDLKVTVGDVALAPGHAPVSWIGFSGTVAAATAMGDIVCTEAELAPVLKAFAAANIAVTAIHDHFNGETPRLAFIHYHAMGSAADLAHRFDGVFAVTGAPRPVATAAAVPLTIDSAQVFNVIGKRGKAAGSVVSLSFALVSEPVLIDGVPAFPALAYGTPMTIQQVSPSRAVASGDFSVLAAQVQPIMRALAAAGITATSVHNHLVGAVPNVYYIHFWGDAPLPALLQGLRAALDAARKDAPATH
jgi:hypothetical protein